ncbi:hypothetical protein L9F63_002335, partial [Diploptera punctata]
AFVHAEQGTLQPQLITVERIKNVMKAQTLPTAPLDFDYDLRMASMKADDLGNDESSPVV